MSTTQFQIHDGLVGGCGVSSSSVFVTEQCPANMREYYSTVTVFTQRDKHPIYGGEITAEQARAHAELFCEAPAMKAELERQLERIKRAYDLCDTTHPVFIELATMETALRDVFDTLKHAKGHP